MEVDSLKVLMKNEVKDGKMYYSIYTAIPFEQIAEKLNEMFKCEDEGSISEKIWRV
jgi:predicted transcriptional regulator